MKFKLPSWLRRDEVRLPAWASLADTGKKGACVTIEVDCEAAYPEWLKALDVTRIDQYWLEVAFQCIKLDVQAAIAGTKYDPRVAGSYAHFHFLRAPKFAQALYPVGKGAIAASQGREAREHYRRIRGSLPM